ncbi:MAG: hypothetical protein ACTSQX_16380 [Candidatus Heimdallarchaeota archaeon]
MKNNLRQQLWMYFIIDFTSDMFYNKLVVENTLTMYDLNKDGDHEDRSELGVYGTKYSLNSAIYTPEETHKMNLTKYIDGLWLGAAVWITDYLEIGGESWEFINGALSGVQRALCQFGMEYVNGQDIVTIANAVRGKRQLLDRSVPKNDQLWLTNPAFALIWKGFAFIVGAAVCSIVEIATKGLVVGLTGGIIGLLASVAAGFLVNIFWNSLIHTKSQLIWKNAFVYPWIDALRGDFGVWPLVVASDILTWIIDLGTNALNMQLDLSINPIFTVIVLLVACIVTAIYWILNKLGFIKAITPSAVGDP